MLQIYIIISINNMFNVPSIHIMAIITLLFGGTNSLLYVRANPFDARRNQVNSEAPFTHGTKKKDGVLDPWLDSEGVANTQTPKQGLVPGCAGYIFHTVGILLNEFQVKVILKMPWYSGMWNIRILAQISHFSTYAHLGTWDVPREGEVSLSFNLDAWQKWRFLGP